MSPQAQASTPSDALDAALEYGRKGLPVFPCSPLDKKPLTPHGFKDAATDEAQIRAWWGKWPNAMIAAPTGPASGVWALDPDVDPVKQLDSSWASGCAATAGTSCGCPMVTGIG